MLKFRDRIVEVVLVAIKPNFTLLLVVLFFGICSCNTSNKIKVEMEEKSTQEILSDPTSIAMCYGGYRYNSRKVQPTIKELKEDMLLLSAMGVKIIRTYNVHLEHAVNVLIAIEELKLEDEKFEMYVMLGAWIDCKNAWTDQRSIHEEESERNAIEINRAVDLANEYPDIVKVIAVGNEAMVKWATAYYVMPAVILKWVNHLQSLKKQEELPSDLWITTSDNFASWGGGPAEYKVVELKQLIHAVDFISLHTYPMHDTHYNPIFWGLQTEEEGLSDQAKVDLAMQRSVEYAKSQYYAVEKYMHSIGVDKPIHIGETGWASFSQGLYGDNGSFACDEYKQAKYYELMREWTSQEEIACFYFEAFDEVWKDAENPEGSENHFGLFTVDGNAKYALWDLVDSGAFDGLERNSNPIHKTHDGVLDSLWLQVKLPPQKDLLIPEYQTQ